MREALLHAKDLTEVMRLHSEYVQAQMRSLAEQASEMGQIVSRAAMDAAKPKAKPNRSDRPPDYRGFVEKLETRQVQAGSAMRRCT